MEWQNSFTTQQFDPNDELEDVLVTHLKSWKMITVTGDDKKSYLQGQLTCDLVSLDEDESTLGAHCDAKGKVWSIFRCFHHGAGYGLFHHASTIDISLSEIKKYSVFSKVEIAASDDILIGLLGQNADQVMDELTSKKGNVRTIQDGTAVRVDDNRWLIAINKDSVEPLLASIKDAKRIDETIWDKIDIENGIPRIIDSIQNSHIPQAFNLQSIDGISFSKGCYTGQETVARAKYRGTNKRMMAIVKGDLVHSEPSTWTLERSVGDNWRNVGEIFTHFTFSDNSAIGLAIIPNNLEADTKLRLSEQPNSIWQIESLPYRTEE